MTPGMDQKITVWIAIRHELFVEDRARVVGQFPSETDADAFCEAAKAERRKAFTTHPNPPINREAMVAEGGLTTPAAQDYGARLVEAFASRAEIMQTDPNGQPDSIWSVDGVEVEITELQRRLGGDQAVRPAAGQ